MLVLIAKQPKSARCKLLSRRISPFDPPLTRRNTSLNKPTNKSRNLNPRRHHLFLPLLHHLPLVNLPRNLPIHPLPRNPNPRHHLARNFNHSILTSTMPALQLLATSLLFSTPMDTDLFTSPPVVDPPSVPRGQISMLWVSKTSVSWTFTFPTAMFVAYSSTTITTKP